VRKRHLLQRWASGGRLKAFAEKSSVFSITLGGGSAGLRLHHNVLAIALANKLARIAWAVLNKERKFECIRTNKMASRAA
jgi:hypothetical protein